MVKKHHSAHTAMQKPPLIQSERQARLETPCHTILLVNVRMKSLDHDSGEALLYNTVEESVLQVWSEHG